MPNTQQIADAREILAYYTLLASGTGAVPVPAASAAVVVQNGVMFSHLASALGAQVNAASVMESIGFAGSLNMAGRALFIEGARLLSWGTGSVWALAGVSALGATTAGVQTYVLGRMAIEIGKNGGQALTPSLASKVVAEAKRSYQAFVAEWKGKSPRKPAGAV